jgi:hypothetical protein
MAELGLSIGDRPAQVVVPPADAVAAAGEPGVIAADSYKPTAEMAEEAERGLAWRREFGRGGTEIGVARARDIANGRPLSLDTVKRMASFFARHAVDEQAEGWRPGEEGYPSAGRIAHALWGGDPAKAFADRVLEEANA